jgi:hypothetical protein
MRRYQVNSTVGDDRVAVLLEMQMRNLEYPIRLSTLYSAVFPILGTPVDLTLKTTSSRTRPTRVFRSLSKN